MTARLFDVAVGTVQGREHVLNHQNNQDAYRWYEQDDVFVAVVADGCGSGDHSEVGSNLGVNWFVNAVVNDIRFNAPWRGQLCLDHVTETVLDRLKATALGMGDGRHLQKSILGEYFLFTLVAVVCYADKAQVVSMGDGVVLVNAETVEWSYPGNKPPYIAYGLLGENPKWTVHWSGHPDELERFVIGTDGVGDLRMNALKPTPNGNSVVHALDDLPHMDALYRNEFALTRTLNLYNADGVQIRAGETVRKYHGFLRDDTTLIVGRRRKGEQ